MNTFIRNSKVNAKAMTRQDYNDLRGWQLPEDENGADAGFLVEELGNAPNVEGFAGYVQWLPREVFESTHESASGMDFGAALRALKAGAKVARAGWDGKDMFLFLVPGSQFVVNRPPLMGIYPEGTRVSYHAHVDMKTAQGDVVPWLCSQTDMLATDWIIVE